MNQKIRIKIEAFDHDVLLNSCVKIQQTISELNAKIVGPISLPTKIRRYCVLRSPHVDKDSREHLEVRKYKKFFDIYDLSSQALDTFLKVNLPSGIAISVKKF